MRDPDTPPLGLPRGQLLPLCPCCPCPTCSKAILCGDACAGRMTQKSWVLLAGDGPQPPLHSAWLDSQSG